MTANQVKSAKNLIVEVAMETLQEKYHSWDFRVDFGYEGTQEEFEAFQKRCDVQLYARNGEFFYTIIENGEEWGKQDCDPDVVNDIVRLIATGEGRILNND